MTEWARGWFHELTDPETYRSSRRAAGAAIAVAVIGFLGATLAVLMLSLLTACGTLGTAAGGGTLTKIGHLLEAASALHELAEQVADHEGTPTAGELLQDELPRALEQLDVALGELCAAGGPLPRDHKVCVHYRAYKADSE